MAQKVYHPTRAQIELRKKIASSAKHILAYGGARSGKTFEIVYNLITLATVVGGRYAIFRQHYNSVRTAIFLSTMPEVLRLCFPKTNAVLHKGGDLYYDFPNTGAEIWGLGLDDAERVDKVLGKEFTAIYFNECSEISYHAVETAITRCSQKTPGIRRNKVLYDCNPPFKTHWAHRLFIEKINPVTRLPLENPENYDWIKLNPEDNIQNLPQGFLDELNTLSPEKKKRFLYGEWLDENPDALWRQNTIDETRITSAPYYWNVQSIEEGLDRIVIGVDPAVTGNEKSDNTGIVVCGVRYEDGSDRRTPHYYVLEDLSLKAHPSEWAAEINRAYHKYQANEIVVETNQGGELVTDTIRNSNYSLPITSVRATHNKRTRAEPIAALYHNGLVHHTAYFAELEDELISYTGRPGEKSPDRMDALVWAITALTDKTEVSGGDVWFS